MFGMEATRGGTVLRRTGGTLAVAALATLASVAQASADAAVAVSGGTLFYTGDDGRNEPSIHQDPGNSGDSDDRWRITDWTGARDVPIIPTHPCFVNETGAGYPDDYEEAYCPKVVSEVDLSLAAGDDVYSHAEGGSPDLSPLVEELFLIARAGPGNDDVSAGDAGSSLFGEEGDDDLTGSADLHNLLDGGPGADFLHGGHGDDELLGGPDNDGILAFSGEDSVEGEDGNDEMDDGPGKSEIDGGADKDKVTSTEGGGDKIDCGPGRDRAVVHKKDKVKSCEKLKRRK
jgi:Ca2+-binding RTX toxin-like protein